MRFHLLQGNLPYDRPLFAFGIAAEQARIALWAGCAKAPPRPSPGAPASVVCSAGVSHSSSFAISAAMVSGLVSWSFIPALRLASRPPSLLAPLGPNQPV